MPFWQFYQKSANWLDWPALLVQPSISAHRKWPEMVVLASTNQVWTKITIRSYVWSFAIQIQIQAVWYMKSRLQISEIQSRSNSSTLFFQYSVHQNRRIIKHSQSIFLQLVISKNSQKHLQLTTPFCLLPQ